MPDIEAENLTARQKKWSAKATGRNNRIDRRRQGLELPLRPARSRRLQAFSKPFQISAIFCQAFPKNVLAVLWEFKGLQ